MARTSTTTRERILRSALSRFARYGFRRTSMEDIAAEAGVSRAALYLQFRNKEEIFRSLSSQLHDEALARAASALNAPGPLAERLRSAIEGKSLRLVEITYGSPHGGELLDENNRLCGDVAAETERRFQALLGRTLQGAVARGEINLGAVGLNVRETAALVARAVSGLRGPGISVDAYRRRLGALVRVLVAGLSARAAVTAKKRRVLRTRTPSSAADRRRRAPLPG